MIVPMQTGGEYQLLQSILFDSTLTLSSLKGKKGSRVVVGLRSGKSSASFYKKKCDE